MSIDWTYRCDGPGCDLFELAGADRESKLMRGVIVTVGGVTIWKGDLCRSCEDKMIERLKHATVHQ